MCSPRFTIPPKSADELDKLARAGVEWTIRDGADSGQLIVNGIPCGAVYRGKLKDVGRYDLNLRSQIRRACRGLRDRKG